MGNIYFTAFFIPAIASVVLLYVLVKQGDLYGKAFMVFVVWFLVSASLQLFARNTVMWLIGLATQAALATILAIRWNTSL